MDKYSEGIITDCDINQQINSFMNRMGRSSYRRHDAHNEMSSEDCVTKDQENKLHTKTTFNVDKIFLKNLLSLYLYNLDNPKRTRLHFCIMTP